jgi:hypothetical protein
MEQTQTYTYDQMMSLFAETRAQFVETRNQFSETRAQFAELSKEMRQSSKEVDKQIKNLGKEIGKIHRERGSYTEIILMPSIEDLVLNTFKHEFFDTNYSRRRGDDEIQIDAIGFTNSERNEVLIIEVKTQLRKEDINQIKKHLKRFDYFYPEHKDKKKYGLIASLSANKKLVEELYQNGIYFAKIKNDILKLEIPDDFQPIAY